MKDKMIPVFLERRSYRQRRLMDFARLLPILGGVLWLLPLLWPEAKPVAMTAATAVAPPQEDGLPMSSAILYVFGVWVVLVAGALVVALYLRDTGGAAGRADAPDA